jgi:hypothetical protein
MFQKPHKLGVSQQITRQYERVGSARIIGRREVSRAQGNAKFERKVTITKPNGVVKTVTQVQYRVIKKQEVSS